MKRFMKMWFCFAIFLGLIIAAPAKADTRNTKIKIKNLAEGKKVTDKQITTERWDEKTGDTTVDSTIIVYKIKVKKPGYLTITHNVEDSRGFFLLAAKPMVDKSGEVETGEYLYRAEGNTKKDKRRKTNVSGEIRYPVAKGVYYLYPLGGDPKTISSGRITKRERSFTIKYTHTAADISPRNYCRTLAAPLKAKQTATICVPLDYDYYRWYKIVLTKKKHIYFKFNDLMSFQSEGPDIPDFTLFELKKDGKIEVGVLHDEGFDYFTSKKLAKGTYYLRVNSFNTAYENRNAFLYKLSWR